MQHATPMNHLPPSPHKLPVGAPLRRQGTRSIVAAIALVWLLSAPLARAAASAPQGQPAPTSAPTPAASELIARLAAETDPVRRAEQAAALGDRHIAGQLSLTDKDQHELNKLVARLLQETRTPKTKSEAEKQLQRLWKLALPGLLKGLDSIETYSASTRQLTIIKDKEVLQALADKARKSDDPRQRGLLRFALEKMKDHREPDIPDRTALPREESDKIYQELIEPVLQELQ